MNIVDDFRSLASLAMKVRDAGIQAEMQETILQAQSQAMELQQQNYKLQTENAELKDRITKLQKIDTIEKDLQLSNKGVYVSKSSGHKFCGACWATSKVLIPVIQMAQHTSTGMCTSKKCQCRYPDLFQPTKDRPTMGRLERS